MRKANPTRRAPHLSAAIALDYPVKPWVDPVTKHVFQTVTVEQDDGRFVSVIASDPRVRFSAKTRKAAEEGVISRYLASSHTRIPIDDEGPEQDAEDIRVIREAERKGEFIPLRDILRKYGRSLDSPRRRVSRS